MLHVPREWAALSILGGSIHVTFPRDSPLVGHLLTSWQPPWLLSRSLPHTCKQVLVGLKNAATASQCETTQMLYGLSSAGVVPTFP